MQIRSWRAGEALQIETVDLHIPAPTVFNAWSSATAALAVHDEMLTVAAPRVVSLAPDHRRPKAISIAFPMAPQPSLPVNEKAVNEKAVNNTSTSAAQQPPAAAGDRPAPPLQRTTTRIKPPGDIIKLEDRLYYLLQPPLESLAAAAAIEFPFEPFPFQYEGIAFLYPRYSAILADEMGLGKTMQAITAIRLLLRAGEIRSVLLVCPKPLVTNWQREFALWAPEIPLTIVEGDPNRRLWQWRQENAPVKIANYELLMRDRDLLTDGQLQFDLVALDEAQRIKNHDSATSRIARSISCTRSWALTGTPIENSPDDLVSIFEFLSPGYLYRGMPLPHMARAVADHVLRRTKEMVLSDLPPKMIRDEELLLTPQQWETYKTAEEEGVLRLAGMGEELTIQHVFELVLRLKQICNFDPATGASSKLERLTADLEELDASGQKAIVFSQWVKTLGAIRDSIARFEPLEYHGGIPSKKRDAVIERFKNDPRRRVLLMSYGAGSVGLNLQFCRYVFLFDRWWNPAVEDQAINRAHRIGVDGPVTITRMLALETIEERINQVLAQKREISAALFAETGAPSRAGLTQNEIFGLFNLRGPSGPVKSAA